MTGRISSGKITIFMALGIVGCILMGSSDWLMIYGDVSYQGVLPWLTDGVAQIPPGRNSMAMFFAFPAVIFYSIALLAVKEFIVHEMDRKLYSALTVVGLTPWLCLHLFYTMILYLFGFLNTNGQGETALLSCEALFQHFKWIIPLSEAIMLLPFIYLFYLFITEKSVFSRFMAFNNPLIIYIVLKLATLVMKNSPVKLAFTNGLMSESMAVWFIIFIAAVFRSSGTRRIF